MAGAMDNRIGGTATPAAVPFYTPTGNEVALFEHAYRNGAWLLATCPDETVRDANSALAGAKKLIGRS